MRKEVRENLSTRYSPESVTSEYSNTFQDWKEKFKSGEYTYPSKVLVVAGGMAKGAAAANGVAYKLSVLGITFPGVFASSSSAMTWGMIQRGYNPLEIQRHMTSFNMDYLKHENVTDVFRNRAVYNLRNLTRHYLRYGRNGNRVEINEKPDINLGFLTTKMPEREPHLYSEGKIITGILASGAFPVVFPPIRDNRGRLLIDGDLSYKLPIGEIVDFLGFRPEEIIYAKLKSKNSASSLVRTGLGVVTNTPSLLKEKDWSDEIPVKKILIELDSEKTKGMSPVDFHKVEQMDHIFEAGSRAVEEFFG